MHDIPNARPMEQCGWIYFVHAECGVGPVKIGFTALPIERRIVALNFSSPLPLRLLAICRGTRWTERWFHNMFLDDHSHGEWFFITDRLRCIVNAINAGAFNLSAEPPPHSLYGLRYAETPAAIAARRLHGLA